MTQLQQVAKKYGLPPVFQRTRVRLPYWGMPLRGHILSVKGGWFNVAFEDGVTRRVYPPDMDYLIGGEWVNCRDKNVPIPDATDLNAALARIFGDDEFTCMFGGTCGEVE